MPITFDLAIAGQIVAIVAAFVAVAGYWHQRRAFVMAEGKQIEKINALIAKVDTQEKKITDLESKSHCLDTDMTEVRADLKYLVASVNEIKAWITDIAPHTVKHE